MKNYELVFLYAIIIIIIYREDDWKSMARTRLRKFEEELQAAIEGGMNTYSGHTTWSFVNAVIYCFDIATTIGKRGFFNGENIAISCDDVKGVVE